MANDTTEFVVGANGAVYLANVGATLPTDESSAYSGAWVQMGLVDDDGVKFDPGVTLKKIMSWQSLYATLQLVTDRSLRAEIKFQQWNRTSVDAAFGGGGTWSEPTSGHYKYVPPGGEDVHEYALGIDWAWQGDEFRLVIPRVMVGDLAAFSLKRNDVATLDMKLEMLNDGVDDAFEFYTNAGQFETAGLS